MCAHAWQLFEISGGQPIAAYSEQAQEHWNKNIQKYKSGCGAKARQHSVKLNMQDIVKRMLTLTHPCIVSKRRQLSCSKCGEIGHTSRSKAHHVDRSNEDEKLIDAMYN